MTDNSRKKVSRKQQKTIDTTSSILKNYLQTQTPAGRSSQLKNLKTHLENRKKNESNTFNINNEMGFIISLNNFNCSYFGDVALYLDDLELFLMFKDFGLSDITPQGKPLWQNLMRFGAIHCFTWYFNNTSIDRYFIDGELNPLHYAISSYAQDAFNLILSHPEFDFKYVQYVNTPKTKNALTLAASAFNLPAVDSLLKINAPCLIGKNKIAAFDCAVMNFLDYYSNNKATQFWRSQDGLNMPCVLPERTEEQKKAMTIYNIQEVLYLLLNKTPHLFNIYQIFPLLPTEKKLNLFERLNELHESHIHFARGSIKILLDILLSIGPGLFFYELPIALRKLYIDLPDNAEICMPVFFPKLEIKYLYTFKEFEDYLNKNINNFKPLPAFNQYIDNRLLRANLNFQKINYLTILKEIILKTTDINKLKDCVVEPKVTSIVKAEVLTAIEMVEKINKASRIELNKDNFGALLKDEFNGLQRLQGYLGVDEFYQKHEENIKYVQSVVLDTTNFLPTIFIHLLRCNEIFNTLNNITAYVHDLGILKNAIAIFEQICSKIDFYIMVSLQHYWKIQKCTAEELIDNLNALLVPVKILHKKINLMRSEEYLPNILRAQYFIYGLLIEAYNNNNQPRLAKIALKEALMISKSSGNPNFFKNIYHNVFHHTVAVQIFAIVLDFSFKHISNHKEIHKHFEQILNYESGLVLQKSFCIKLKEYILKCIEDNLFIEVERLFVVLQKYKLNDSVISIAELELLYADKIDLNLNKIQSILLSSDFFARFKLDLEKKILIIDCNEITYSLKYIQKRIPVECKSIDKIFFLEEIHFYSIAEIEGIMRTLNYIFELDLKRKQKQTEGINTTDNDLFELEGQLSYLSLYNSHSQARIRQKRPKKVVVEFPSRVEKPIKIIKNSENINRSELKRMANLGEEFTDLILIISNYSNNEKKFLVIKKDDEFSCFLEACHQFENDQGEWGVKSINPYGRNQHGVKLYENKCDDTHKVERFQSKIQSEKFVIKIKGSGSDRAIGIGKEVQYLGETYIIYVVDEILNHKKADKLCTKISC